MSAPVQRPEPPTLATMAITVFVNALSYALSNALLYVFAPPHNVVASLFLVVIAWVCCGGLRSGKGDDDGDSRPAK